jgi:putative phosphoesterase
MRIGIFADTHDHMDNIRWAVAEFNRLECGLVVFAGDFVSTIALPPMRKLNCPMIASFGDNEGNKLGIRGGMHVIGEVAEPPFGFRTADGLRILVTHQRELVRGLVEGSDVVIYAHTHRPRIHRDEAGRLFINPGETSGWTYGEPSIAVLETAPLAARLIQITTTSAVVASVGRQVSHTGERSNE